MPKRYEKMRDAFVAEGMSEKQAKTKAAKIYNATRKGKEPKLSPAHKARVTKER